MKGQPPEYDPKRDGNVFAWILSAAQQVRARTVVAKRPLFTPEQWAEIRSLDADVEQQEREHFDRLRAESWARKATQRAAQRKQP